MRAKAILLIFSSTLISINSIQGQYGADGAVAAGGHWALWAVEKKDLETISDGQDLLLIANVTLALEEAKLSDISKKRYESLSNIDDDVKNALTLGQIIEHSLRLYNTNDAIIEIIDGEPLVQAIISPAVADLFLEQALLLASVVNAETEGQNNLMDSSERFRYMRRILADIDRINDLAYQVRGAAKTLVDMSQLEEIETIPMPTYTFDEAITNIQEEINALVKD